MESLYSHENIVDDFQEEGKQTIIQHEMIEDMAEEMEPSKMMKYQCVPLPLMKQSKNHFLLHNKRKMRLVVSISNFQ
jgi:hypothetical protein